jgi:hypothetical protein
LPFNSERIASKLSAQWLPSVVSEEVILLVEVTEMIRTALKFGFALFVVVFLTAAVARGQQSARIRTGNALDDAITPQRPLMSDYKGVRIGMTAEEAHARLGTGMRIDEQEFYVINERESLQLAFDSANKVIGISVDYLGGVGAPDYRSVVGPDINVKLDGSMYKMIRYEQLGFWVSYSRTPNTAVMMVSITIGKII